MANTIDDIKASLLGYLSGADILRWCPAQILQNQMNVDANSLQFGYDQAASEAIANFRTKYDVASELNKTPPIAPDPDTRSPVFVKLLSILTVRNALGRMQNISDKMQADFTWADSTIRAIRNGQMNLPLLVLKDDTLYSGAEIIPSSFSTLG